MTPALTTAQKTTLKSYIDSQPDLGPMHPNTFDGNEAIRVKLNALASPAYLVFKTKVTITAVGEAFDAAELAGLSTLNNTRLQTLAIYLSAGVNPSLQSVRLFFDDIFSGTGGQVTRASLANLWRRSATRVETVFATGNGQSGTPSTLGPEGLITNAEINDVRNL